MISYVLYVTGAALVRVFPRRIAKGIATILAFTFFVTRPRIRKNVRHNYEALGVPAGSTFAVFHNFSHAVTDFLRLPHLTPEQITGMCRLTGIGHLEKALKEGTGAILFAPHLGPWELAGAYLPTLGYRLSTVALEHPSRMVTRFFSRVRRGWGLTDYPLNACAGELMRALGRGEIVVLLIDRSFSKRGMRLPFLAAEATLPIGHVVLSLRSGAPLVPCCCYYCDDGRIEIRIEEAIGAGRQSTPAALAAVCLSRIERFIREHADQWFAFDNLWPKEAHG